MVNLYGNGPIGKVVSGNNYYYVKDHLGSIRTTVTSSGTFLSAQDYYAFGGILNQSGTGDNRYKFTGKQRDDETNYDYFGFRYYDSELGIWHSMDHLSDDHPGESPYVYCSNNPLSIVDDDGMEGHWENDPSDPEHKMWVLDEVTVTADKNNSLETLAAMALAVDVFDPEPVTKSLLVTALITYEGIKFINYLQEQTKPDATNNEEQANPEKKETSTNQINQEIKKGQAPAPVLREG